MSTVLIVEDSRAQREMMIELLKRAGLNVIFASDGVEALAMIKSYCPDLVLLDVILPKMNGYEVCRRIKGDLQTQMLPVVILSIKNETWDVYWGSKQGADAYVSKFCHPQELVSTIKRLLQQSAEC